MSFKSTYVDQPGVPSRVLPADLPFQQIRWRHRKGGFYWIISFAIREADLCPLVCYQSVDGGMPFIREAEEFFDGRFQMAGDQPAPDKAGERDDSDMLGAVSVEVSEKGWQGQLIPKIGMDIDKRSIVIGDMVTLARPDDGNNNWAWGPKPKRRVVDIARDGVRLEPGGRDPDYDVWRFEAIRYAGTGANEP